MGGIKNKRIEQEERWAKGWEIVAQRNEWVCQRCGGTLEKEEVDFGSGWCAWGEQMWRHFDPKDSN